MVFKTIVVTLWSVIFGFSIWGIYRHRREGWKHLSDPLLVKKDIDAITSTAVFAIGMAILGGICIAQVLLGV